MDFLTKKAISAAIIIACGVFLIVFSFFLPQELMAVTLLPGFFLIAVGSLELREYRELSKIIEMGKKALKRRQ
ncbi:MAG: hypothetical protein QXX33_00095 [Candidatus Hadarchaeales archaeon]